VAVWDPLVRLLHWTLVLAVGVTTLTTFDALSRWADWHEPAGYVAVAAVVLRTAWGFAGRGHARFADFVRGPRSVFRYAVTVWRRTEKRYVGHNPLGGWMVLALLLCMAFVCATGILYTTDRFWGEAWVEIAHRASAWTLVGLVALHLGGVLFTGWRHRENLVAAMVGGRKRAPRDEGDDA